MSGMKGLLCFLFCIISCHFLSAWHQPPLIHGTSINGKTLFRRGLRVSDKTPLQMSSRLQESPSLRNLLPANSRKLYDFFHSAGQYLIQDPKRLQYVGANSVRVTWFLIQTLLAQILIQDKKVNQVDLSLATAVLEAFSKILDPNAKSNEVTINLQASEPAAGDDQSSVAQQRLAFFTSLLELFKQDLQNIETGVYKVPYDYNPLQAPKQWNPLSVMKMVSVFLSDSREIERRRRAKNGLEVREHFKSNKYPDYYLQNFHYQSDGWLSPKSAYLYDYQVESLFLGAADMMRRQILPAIKDYLRDLRVKNNEAGVYAPCVHLDVATGTGRFASFLLDNFPYLNATVLDLSPQYLDEAKRMLKRFPLTTFAEASVESMPFEDETFDSMTCVYLFHELPDEVRRSAAKEMARVLKPGGKLFFVDSVQDGDISFKNALTGFPGTFHEPYYMNYTKTDLTSLFAEHELILENSTVNWVSKCMVFEKVPSVYQ